VKVGDPASFPLPSFRFGNRARRGAIAAIAFCCVLLLTACGHKKTARVNVPPAPEQTGKSEAPRSAAKPDLTIPAHAKPIYEETGIASWYGPPYNHRRAANGEVFDMYGLSAAHRTLPLNCVARVTNVETGQSVVVRINDRGPFIEGRMLDLSLGAAKKTDVWPRGLAKVKLEVYQSPAAIDHGERWCVKIGAFSDREHATKFKEKLQKRYRTASVLQFPGPTGYWIRVRVQDDDKHRAESLYKETKVPEGAAFLVRLD
jgi:rare lipoprotein A